MNRYYINKDTTEDKVKSQVLERAKAIKRVFGTPFCLHSISVKTKEISQEVILTPSISSLFKIIKCNDLVYVRHWRDYLFLLPVRIKKVQIVYDFRGFVAYESFLRNKSYLRFIVIFAIEFFCYLTASKVYTVSHSFADILKKKFILKRKITVIPCLPPKNLKQNYSTSKKNNILEKNLNTLRFVYIGSVHKWQKIEEIISVFDAIADNMEASLSIITHEPDNINKLLMHMDPRNRQKIDTFSIKPLQAIKVLEEYDFGFLIRDNLILNRVASPLKFHEYCSAGVVPIITPYVGDFSKVVQEKGIGLIYNYDHNELVQKIRNVKNLKDLKKEARAFASEYTWEKYLVNNFQNQDNLI